MQQVGREFTTISQTTIGRIRSQGDSELEAHPCPSNHMIHILLSQGDLEGMVRNIAIARAARVSASLDVAEDLRIYRKVSFLLP